MMNATRRVSLVSVLLFLSGASSLICETVWLRQFRLIFGASTFATGAVVAVFLGGIGVGSRMLATRAERSPNPLFLYGIIEMLIAAGVLLSQPLIALARVTYFATGGSTQIGIIAASAVRLLLAGLVLIIPTFMMGGTLPAAARAVESAEDSPRRHVAVLYAVNTAGGFIGTLATTFYLLERLGNQRSLMLAVVGNSLAGLGAVLLSKRFRRAAADPQLAEAIQPAAESSRLIVLASATAGFAFVLMELVWYRVLAPIVGGTTFMFGLILAVALLGIGIGGALYALRRERSTPTTSEFAITCALEAAAMIVPFALGDRVAVLANLLRSLSFLGFIGSALSWSAITVLVVLAPAIISGYQLPLLIGLLGKGDQRVAAQVGLAYAANTAGAMVGSIAGGFGLIPLLSAAGCWRLAVWLLALFALAAAIRGWRLRAMMAGFAALTSVVAIGGTFALGPTVGWMQSGIGAGRAPVPRSPNETEDWLRKIRRTTMWAADGRESSIAVSADNDLSFMVNGKSDGSARSDAGTQVMGGLLPALLHPSPHDALVVGLGTGASAGWLARVPEMRRVDVVELEPLVVRVAHDFRATNQDPLSNPKVHLAIADAREVLLTTRRSYDVITSEPSNPYRAGVSSLFTKEFYEAVSARLRPKGIFAQWVQGYEIDAVTLATIYATLRTVFPNVQTWETQPNDFLLVASRSPIVFDIPRMRGRLASEPYRSAVENAWAVEGAEGVVSKLIGSESFAGAVALSATTINTDDRTPTEFGFARALFGGSLDVSRMIQIAQRRGDSIPENITGLLDQRRVYLERASDPSIGWSVGTDQINLIHAGFAMSYARAEFQAAVAIWQSSKFTPINGREVSALGDVLAFLGQADAERIAEFIRILRPAEAESLVGILRLRQGRFAEAANSLEAAMIGFRSNAWSNRHVINIVLDSSVRLASSHPEFAPALFRAMSEPFAARQFDDQRRIYRISIARAIKPCGVETIAALKDVEPWSPWDATIIQWRRECYAAAGEQVLARRAARDYERLMSQEPARLLEGVDQPPMLPTAPLAPSATSTNPPRK